MTLGANQIGAYAADLLDLEDQIEALQLGKRDTFKAIRDEHGKSEANALKLALKLHRMDAEKRGEAEAVDTEAQRMLAIIEKGRAPRATRAREIIEEFDAETGVVTESTAARMDVPGMRSDPLKHLVVEGSESGTGTSTVKVVAGTQAPPVDTQSRPLGTTAPTTSADAATTSLPAEGDAARQLIPEPLKIGSSDPQWSAAATRKDADVAAPEPFRNSKGILRQPGCIDPEDCAGGTKELCWGCKNHIPAAPFDDHGSVGK